MCVVLVSTGLGAVILCAMLSTTEPIVKLPVLMLVQVLIGAIMTVWVVSVVR